MAKDRKRKRKEEGTNGGREGEREKDRETEMERKEGGKEEEKKEGRRPERPGHSSSLECAMRSLSEAPALSALAYEQIKRAGIHPQSQGAGSQYCWAKWCRWTRTKGQAVRHHTMERGSLCWEADGLEPSKWPCDA